MGLSGPWRTRMATVSPTVLSHDLAFIQSIIGAVFLSIFVHGGPHPFVLYCVCLCTLFLASTL